MLANIIKCVQQAILINNGYLKQKKIQQQNSKNLPLHGARQRRKATCNKYYERYATATYINKMS